MVYGLNGRSLGLGIVGPIGLHTGAYIVVVGCAHGLMAGPGPGAGGTRTVRQGAVLAIWTEFRGLPFDLETALSRVLVVSCGAAVWQLLAFAGPSRRPIRVTQVGCVV